MRIYCTHKKQAHAATMDDAKSVLASKEKTNGSSCGRGWGYQQDASPGQYVARGALELKNSQRRLRLERRALAALCGPVGDSGRVAKKAAVRHPSPHFCFHEREESVDT